MDSLDPNKIAAQVVVQATEQAINRVSVPAGDKVRRVLQKLSNAYGPYLETTFDRVRTIRTFLKPTESIDLLDNYVSVDLTNREKSYQVADVLERLVGGERFVISGLAGRGKSVLMRYIALSLYHAPRGKIPLFMELRNLNGLTSKKILQYFHSQYKGKSNVKYSDFVSALNAGYFILIMDGFDEIAPQDRSEVERQILEIASEFEAVPIVVSGRPYDRFSSWEKFTTVHLKPMSLGQTRQLIDQSNYDGDVKKTFLKRLDADFYQKHESFLNTPLLAIMLMLTFEEYAEIPESLHVFYRNAFDTLVRRHDAMKAQFLRRTHSGFTAEQLKSVFASFCLLTYSQSKFTFHRDEIVKFLKSALSQQKIVADPEALLSDLVESICLLQEEGFEIFFVHRSFQEYFCALFVSQAPAGFVKKYLDSGKFRIFDDVLPMLSGMVPDRVEAEWAAETVSNIRKSFPKIDDENIQSFTAEMWRELVFDVRPGKVISIMFIESEFNRTIEILERLYPAQFHAMKSVIANDSKHRTKKQGQEWNREMVMILKQLEAEGVKSLKGVTKLIESDAVVDDGRDFHMPLSQGTGLLIEKLDYNKYSNANLKAIYEIGKEQENRIKREDKFLKEVFAS